MESCDCPRLEGTWGMEEEDKYWTQATPLQPQNGEDFTPLVIHDLISIFFFLFQIKQQLQKILKL